MMTVKIKNTGAASFDVPYANLVPGGRCTTSTAAPDETVSIGYQIPPTNDVVGKAVNDWAVGVGASISLSFEPGGS